MEQKALLSEEDIWRALELFPPDEGSIQLVYGRIGSGKTYCLTADILDDLRRGQVVYANWRVNFDEFDERKSIFALILGILGFKNAYARIPRENFHYIDLTTPEMVRGFPEWLATRTDCTIYIDEGHTVLNSYEKTDISKKKQNAITFTRHFNRRIVFASQRFQNIHVQARANVNYYMKCERVFKLGRLVRFKKTTFEDLDSDSMVDEENPSFVQGYWGSQKVFRAYDTKYMRGGIKPSQRNFAELYRLGYRQIWNNLLYFLQRKSSKRSPELGEKII